MPTKTKTQRIKNKTMIRDALTNQFIPNNHPCIRVENAEEWLIKQGFIVNRRLRAKDIKIT